MTSNFILRSAFVSASVLAALSAQAVTIGLTSMGSVSGASSNIVNESVLAQVGGYGPLSSVSYVATASQTPNDLGGNLTAVGSYTGAGGTLNFSMVFAQPVQSFSTGTYSGMWTATGGTGTYQDATGGGTFGLNVFGTSSSFTISSGEIQATPEPTSMAVLAIGGLGLLRRRKKA